MMGLLAGRPARVNLAVQGQARLYHGNRGVSSERQVLSKQDETLCLHLEGPQWKVCPPMR